MDNKIKCSHCGKSFIPIADRNSFGDVCLCNECLEKVPNLTILVSKLKSGNPSIHQLDEGFKAIDKQLEKGYFSNEVIDGIHAYLDKFYKERQGMDERRKINLKLDSIIEKKASHESMSEERFTELVEDRNDHYDLESIIEGNDLYEYDVVTVTDRNGRTNISNLKKTLMRYSVQGWRLKTAFTNEIGTNMIGTAIVGVGVGSNSTSDEVVLIFERKIRSAKKEL